MATVSNPINIDDGLELGNINPKRISEINEEDYIERSYSIKTDLNTTAFGIDETKKHFQEYHSSRELRKSNVYGYIFIIGICIGFISLMLFLSILWLDFIESEAAFLAGVIISTVAELFGLSIAFSVPPLEFDFIQSIIRRKIYIQALSFIGVLFWIFYGVLVIMSYPQAPFVYYNLPVSLMCIGIGISSSRTIFMKKVTYNHVFLKMKRLFILFVFTLLFYDFVYFLTPPYDYYTELPLLVNFICFGSYFVLCIIQNMDRNSLKNEIWVKGRIKDDSNKKYFLYDIEYDDKRTIDHKDGRKEYSKEEKNISIENIKKQDSTHTYSDTSDEFVKDEIVKIRVNSIKVGDGNQVILIMLYRLAMVSGINYVINGIVAAVFKDYQVMVAYLFLGLSVILPIVLAYRYGHSKIFIFTVKLFENDILTILNDGINLARLVQQCTICACEKEAIYWFHRNKNFISTLQIDDNIDMMENRRINPFNWYKAEMIHDSNTTEDAKEYCRFKVSYTDDMRFLMNPDYKYYFENNSRLTKINDFNSKEINSIPFDSWLKNFEDLQALEIDREKKVVTFKSITKETEIKLNESLLRKFDSKRINDPNTIRLLCESPRDATDEEKVLLLEQSEIVTLEQLKKQKIDFFISHSWADKKDEEGLRQFISALETCSVNFLGQNKREPTLWLDRFCINQKSLDGVALLPVNVLACEKFLILLGPTYLTRLWCLWEIFVLFIFSNKELGLEKIEIDLLVDKKTIRTQLENFDIDNAHCYDPNEEYKLKYILLEVVQDKAKLEKIIKYILQEKLKIYLDSREASRIGSDDDSDDRYVSTEDTSDIRQSIDIASFRESFSSLMNYKI